MNICNVNKVDKLIDNFHTLPMVRVIRVVRTEIHRSDQPVYTISVAAELLGVHPRTLRIYEEEGLVSPRRTRTRIRLYSQDDIAHVREVMKLMDQWSLNLSGVLALFEAAERLHIALDRMMKEMLEE